MAISRPTIPFIGESGFALLCEATALTKLKAPIMLPVSVIATPGILSFTAAATKSAGRIVA